MLLLDLLGIVENKEWKRQRADHKIIERSNTGVIDTDVKVLREYFSRQQNERQEESSKTIVSTLATLKSTVQEKEELAIGDAVHAA
jgi:hypothetical protein